MKCTTPWVPGLPGGYILRFTATLCPTRTTRLSESTTFFGFVRACVRVRVRVRYSNVLCILRCAFDGALCVRVRWRA